MAGASKSEPSTGNTLPILEDKLSISSRYRTSGTWGLLPFHFSSSLPPRILSISLPQTVLKNRTCRLGEVFVLTTKDNDWSSRIPKSLGLCCFNRSLDPLQAYRYSLEDSRIRDLFKQEVGSCAFQSFLRARRSSKAPFAAAASALPVNSKNFRQTRSRLDLRTKEEFDRGRSSLRAATGAWLRTSCAQGCLRRASHNPSLD